MKPEKERLLDDLADDESRREATLLAAAAILRRRRHWRLGRQTLFMAALAAATIWGVAGQNERRPQPARASQSTARAIAASTPQELTDQQLLALFPNTPVGLATLPNGKKLLLFLRPADAAKYAIRL